MSNDNEIYPLERQWMDEAQDIHTRSVNQRLAPIFRALLDDPDEWEYEVRTVNGNWEAISCLPADDYDCNHFRLARKRKTITVEIPAPDRISTDGPVGICALKYFDVNKPRETKEAICKAMEGK